MAVPLETQPVPCLPLIPTRFLQTSCLPTIEQQLEEKSADKKLMASLFAAWHRLQITFLSLGPTLHCPRVPAGALLTPGDPREGKQQDISNSGSSRAA